MFLRNGVGRANLSLGPRRDAPGPLERNVLKNLLAERLSAGIRAAGLALSAGDAASAQLKLDVQLSLLEGLRREVAGWANDVELRNDVHMVSEYRAALATAATRDEEAQRQLADSMQYAGFLKVQARRR